MPNDAWRRESSEYLFTGCLLVFRGIQRRGRKPHRPLYRYRWWASLGLTREGGENGGGHCFRSIANCQLGDRERSMFRERRRLIPRKKERHV